MMPAKEFLKTITPQKLLLIDSIGALVSSAMLGLVLAQHEAEVGIPATPLHLLASIAFLFSIYSLLGYLGKLGKYAYALKGIAAANLFYCCLTIALMIYFYHSIMLLGIAYFIIEKCIVVPLAVFEWHTSTIAD